MSQTVEATAADYFAPVRRRRPRVMAYAAVAALLAAAGVGSWLGVRHHQISTANPLVTGEASGGGMVSGTIRLLSHTGPTEIYQTVRNTSSHSVVLTGAGEDAGVVKPGITVHAVTTSDDHAFRFRDVPADPFPVTIPAGRDVGLVVTFPAGCHDIGAGGSVSFDTVNLTLRYRGQTLHRMVAFSRPVTDRC